MTGAEYANLIASYVATHFGGRGISVYREVPLGKTMIGKNRRIDILVIEEPTRTAMVLECKYQGSAGSMDEKIPYALSDLAQFGLPACLVYGGKGFSLGIRGTLEASPLAAACMPGPDLKRTPATRQLDAALAMTFRWWDLVVHGRARFDPASHERKKRA